MIPNPLPPRAKWRGLTAPCRSCGSVHLSFLVEFDAGVETVLRLRLSAATVQDLRAVLAPGYLTAAGDCQPCRDQSDRSSGNPQADVSMPDECEKVCPPTRSSSACSGE